MSKDQKKEFLFAGSSAVAAIVITNPMDVVRTRLQLQSVNQKMYSGISHAIYKMAKHEGISCLQKGLSAACLLQFSNVAMRFGAYNVIKQKLNMDTHVHYGKAVFAGGVSGGLAGLVSSPFFLLKNRMQSPDCTYTSVVDGMVSIYKKDGVVGYYRGVSAFVPRVMAASAVQLSTYDVVKGFLMKQHVKDGVVLHFASSLLTSMAVVAAMQPFDFAATKTMSCLDGKFKGPMDVIVQTIQEEGVKGVYKGSLASYLRFGPYCILVFVFLEQMRANEDLFVL